MEFVGSMPWSGKTGSFTSSSLAILNNLPDSSHNSCVNFPSAVHNCSSCPSIISQVYCQLPW